MYYSFGLASVLQTVGILSRPHAVAPLTDAATLRQAYLQFLRSEQPEVPRRGVAGPSIRSDAGSETELSEFFRIDCPLNDKDQTEVIEASAENPMRAANSEFLEDFLDGASLDPGHRDLFRLVVTDVFTGRSRIAKGGSASGAIGVIWLNEPMKYQKTDLVELLTHELAHQLMFLDEKRHVHYLDYLRVAQKDHYARSAILSEYRPLDKVLHSLVVAAEVVRMREARGLGEAPSQVHPGSAEIRRRMAESTASIRANPLAAAVLAPRAWALIEVCEAVAKS